MIVRRIRRARYTIETRRRKEGRKVKEPRTLRTATARNPVDDLVRKFVIAPVFPRWLAIRRGKRLLLNERGRSCVQSLGC